MVQLPRTLTGVSVILPVVTETTALDETVRVLHGTIDGQVDQLLIVVCDRTTPQSLARCEAVSSLFGDRVQVHRQTLPYLGGAMREAFALATASHTLMMASDLETDPRLAAAMIALGEEYPRAIITASRWATGGGFSGYGRARVALNAIFQKLASVMYRSSLTDATFGYRLFPTALLQGIEWTGLRHELLLETILKPLRLGVEVREVATHWHPRPDGESQNSLATQARYIPTLFRTRFLRTASFVRAADSSCTRGGSA